jgi:lipopolysaccharide transport system permease protein
MGKIIIDAEQKRGLSFNLKEIYSYKDLLYTFTYRDLKIRYAQTLLGIVWVVIQPIVKLLILIVVFNKVAGLNTGKIPYPLFVITGLTVWTYMSTVINQAGNSFIGAQNMIKKIYFPRIILPLSKTITSLVDFAVSIFLIFALMLWYKYPLTSSFFLFPLFLLLAIVGSFAVGIWLSALTIKYRDFNQLLPFLIQFGLYASPIAYSVKSVPDKYSFLFYCNPATGIIEGFRWSLLGGELNLNYVYTSVVMVIILFFSGLLFFKQSERTVADII